MTQISLTLRDGSIHDVQIQPGVSLMHGIREAGFDDLLALCGGSCSCATCHVHITNGWIDKVGLPGPDENDLLDGASDRDATSRLSCQVTISDSLAGLTATIAAEG